MFIILADRW